MRLANNRKRRVEAAETADGQLGRTSDAGRVSSKAQLQELPSLVIIVRRHDFDQVLHRTAVEVVPVIRLDSMLQRWIESAWVYSVPSLRSLSRDQSSSALPNRRPSSSGEKIRMSWIEKIIEKPARDQLGSFTQ
jgi:hypothetical protein